jgi:hypothetical protein
MALVPFDDSERGKLRQTYATGFAVRITRIEIENWRCFRGKHSVDLDSGAHAIVARHETDPPLIPNEENFAKLTQQVSQ